MAVIVAALWIGTPALAVVVGGGAVIGAWELRGLLGRIGSTPPAWLILPLTVWLGDSLRAARVGHGDGLGVRARPRWSACWPGSAAGERFAGWALAVGGAIYIGLCLGFWVAIYRWHVPDPNHLGLPARRARARRRGDR